LEISATHIIDFEEMVNQKIRSNGTLKQWRATEKKLKEFISHKFKRQDLELSRIEYSFASKFYDYLTFKRIPKLGEAAAMKQISNTKQLLTTAETNKYIKKNQLKNSNVAVKNPKFHLWKSS